MAHWAKINENSIVENVIVTSNDEADEGESWIAENLGGIWVKTSYNTIAGKHKLGGEPLRKNFASVGFTYDEARDAFIPPKPSEEYMLDEATCTWYLPELD